MFFSRILRNPCTEWLYWLLKSFHLQVQNPGLRVHYLAKAYGCRFGDFNVLQERCLLVDSSLGDGTYVGRETFLSNVTVGKYCSIGPYVRGGMGSHPIRGFASSHPAFFSAREQGGIIFARVAEVPEFAPITIGNDVWIGASALLKDGINIGDGAVIAMGAVVATHVPPYSIYGGVPAKLIGYRFTEAQITGLLRGKWWDKDHAWLQRHANRFRDVDSLLQVLAP